MVIRCMAGVIVLSVVAYAAYVGITWLRYGHPALPASAEDMDPLLDRFMPTYEVAERHHVRVAAPAEITLAAAFEVNLQESTIIRGIFNTRQLILRAKPEEWHGPNGFVAQAKAWGWGVLAEVPGREIVFGSVTQPWAANVIFRALAPNEFVAFHEPGYAKIVWTLRADPAGPSDSVACTETRVATTDYEARWKFRRYWSVFSPGIVLIRYAALGLVKADAERRSKTHKSESIRSERRSDRGRLLACTRREMRGALSQTRRRTVLASVRLQLNGE